MDKQKSKEVPTRSKEGDSKMSVDRDKSKTHKLSLKGGPLSVYCMSDILTLTGSSKMVADFV